MSKTLYKNSSFVSKTAKLSINNDLKILKKKSLLGYIYWISLTLLLYSNSFASFKSIAWIILIIITFSLLPSTIGFPFTISSYLKLNKDMKTKDLISKKGIIKIKNDSDTRHTIYRYELELEGDKKRYIIDKSLYTNIKVGEAIKFIHLKKSRIVTKYII